MLRETEPGLLYYLASKPNMIRAVDRCNRNIVARVEWSGPGASILKLVCEDGAQVTMSAEERLVPHCDCLNWTKNSQCMHVVTTWIQLKRLLSPKSFNQIRIDGWVLRDLGDLIGFPPADGKPEGKKDRAAVTKRGGGKPAAHFGKIPAERRNIRPSLARIIKEMPIRFVLEERFGRLRGAFRRGMEEINRWTVDVPGDVLHFMRRFPFFDARVRYLSAMLEATKSAYPIVFLEESGRETPLDLKSDPPWRACLAFTLEGGRVTVSRTCNGHTPPPENLVITEELLIDLDGGSIHPLTNRAVWGIWKDIREWLLAPDEKYIGNYFDGEGDGTLAESTDAEAGFESGDESRLVGTNRIDTTLERFNTLALRLTPGMIPGFGDTVFFFHDTERADPAAFSHPSYRLELNSLAETGLVKLIPLVTFEPGSYTFSSDLFRYFNPWYRDNLSPALKAKKRVRTIVETCFKLADAGTPTERKSIIRTALGGPDYVKRSVKNDARQLLNTFADDLLKKPLMIQAGADGWYFAADDRMIQSRLMRILYEFFGTVLFEAWRPPGEITHQLGEVLAVLPSLAKRLQQDGFQLTMDGEPLSHAVWDFSLDATSSTLDWFELRPEIRCDGELLGGEELRQLTDVGMLRREGRLILIDERNAGILAMLAGTIPQPKRGKKAAHQVTRIPRLQILDWLQLRSHGVTVRLSPRDAGVMESLLNFDSIPERPLPPTLTATLRPYQRDGYRWLAFLYEHRFGACLADDMGLGKTVQGISLLAGINDGAITDAGEPHAPHLIVVPPSLLFNWESEVARFFPSARCLTYGGQRRSCDNFGNFHIILTSYGIIQRDIEKLAAIRFNVIIFDEAQLVKNLRAATTGAARRLVGAFKLALTGTPVENRIEEYYSIMDLCLPGLLGSPEQFRNLVVNGGQGGMDILRRRTRPFVLRRDKNLIAADLPEKIEHDIRLELSPRQKVLYQRTIEEVRGRIDEAFASRSAGQARIIALTALLRLRQICLAPSLALEGGSDSSPKLDFLVEQLAELRDEGHSALVFSQFTSYLDIVEAGLKRHHFSCLRLDGSTPPMQRKKLVQTFQRTDAPLVFLISLKAGGKGLNLTRATYVYHLDPWWNPAVENQASDRVHRIGQTRRVTITRLIMRHTIEEKMMLLKEQKQKLYRAILEEGISGERSGLTREDLEFLLG